MGKLKKLETLCLSGNRIERLPPTLGQLKALRTLNLSGNQISEFPLGLGTLRQLDMLDLSRNHIHSVPPEVSDLQAIEINLNQNQVCLLEYPRGFSGLKNFLTKLFSRSRVCPRRYRGVPV